MDCSPPLQALSAFEPAAPTIEVPVHCVVYGVYRIFNDQIYMFIKGFPKHSVSNQESSRTAGKFQNDSHQRENCHRKDGSEVWINYLPFTPFLFSPDS